MSENGAGNEAVSVNTRELQELLRSLKETILELRETVDEIYNPVIKKQKPIGTEHEHAGSLEQGSSGQKGIKHTQADGSGRTASTGPKKSRGEGLVVVAGDSIHNGSERVMCDGNSNLKGDNGRNGINARTIGFGPGSVMQEDNSGGSLGLQGLGGLVDTLRKGQMDLSRLAGLLRLLYDLQTKVPPEYLAGLADILYDSGLVDERQRDTLKRLIELAHVGREHGLSIDESIAILAALARELGLDITQVTDQLVRAILEARGGAAAWEPQQQ